MKKNLSYTHNSHIQDNLGINHMKKIQYHLLFQIIDHILSNIQHFFGFSALHSLHSTFTKNLII
jgi:hypothetical protein